MRRIGIQFRFFIALILVAVIPLVLFGIYGYKTSSDLVERVEMERMRSFHASIEYDIESYFENSQVDLEFLKDLLAMDWAEHMGTHNVSDHDDDFAKHTVSTFVSFLETHGHYDHLRLLDASGMELIRVNNINGNQVVMPDDRLQDKSDRYYYKNAMNLVSGEVYTTAIDLNIENGQIEQPNKAVIRYVAPMDLLSENSSVRYYLIVNLNVTFLLDELRDRIENSPYDHTYMTDDKGYYLIYKSIEKEWGGPSNKNTGASLKNDVENTSSWQEIDLFEKVTGEHGQGLGRLKNEFVYWTPLHINTLSGTRLNLLTVEPREDFMAPVYAYLQTYLGLILTTMIVLFIISILIARTLSHPIKHIAKAVSEIGRGNFNTPLEVKGGMEVEVLAYEIKKMAFELESSYRDMESRVEERTIELQNAHDEMERMANTDPLTGIFNRHYFNNYIEDLKRDKRIKNLALIMLDVDRFKYINDHYGHNVGDVVLQEVAKMLSGHARGSDFAVRYGGDEFLIVLMAGEEEAIKSYINRIEQELKTWNESTEILDHDMEFSIGYDIYTSGKHIMDVIKTADERMYEAKMARRKERGQVGRV